MREDVSRIILTHGHVDHVGSAAEIASWSGAEVVVGRGDAYIVRSGDPAPQPRLTDAELALVGPHIAGEVAPSPACRVDREVVDGDHLGSAAEITVVHGRGHTEGSIALHWADLGVLLTGDTLAESDGRVILGPFNLDRDAARVSAQRMSRLGADIVGFGHGDPVLTGGEQRLLELSDPLA